MTNATRLLNDSSTKSMLRKSFIFTITMVCALIAFATYGTPKGEAITPGEIPAYLKSDFTSYNNNPNVNKYYLTNWVSLKGQPSNCCSITVPYDTTLIDFEVHGAVWLHKTLLEAENGATYAGLPRDGEPNNSADSNYLTNRIRINSYSENGTGSLSATDVGAVLTTSYTNTTRYWFPASVPTFRYNTPALKATQTVTITLNTTTINTFKGNQYYCGGDGASVATATSFASCPSATQSFVIEIVVTQPTAKVTGFKVTDNGGDTTNRDTALDGEVVRLESATAGYNKTRSANPFRFEGADAPLAAGAGGTYTISVPAKPGWVVVGTAFCDLQLTTDSCAGLTNDPETYTGYNAAGNGDFRPGTSRVFGPLTAGHEYAFRIVYKRITSNNWNLVPTSTVNTPTARPGDTVYFEHYITNDGNNTAQGNQWNYQILSSTGTGAQGSTAGVQLTGGAQAAVGANFGNSRTYYIPNGTPNGTRICQRAYVSPSREGVGSSSATSLDEACVVVGNNPPPAPGCAGMPNPASSYVDVVLPHRDVSDPPPPTFSDNAWDSNVEQRPYTTGTGTTKETKVQPQPNGLKDISTGGDRVEPTLVSESFQTAKLDYTPYISAYPYDYNQPSVTYDSYYSQRTWTTSGTPDHYECRTGKPNLTLSGSTCSYNYTAYNNFQCAPGDTGGGSSSTCTNTINGTYGNHYSCPSGTTLSGSNCTYAASGTSPNMTCPKGGSGGGTNSTCTLAADNNQYYDCPAGYSGGGWSSTCYKNYTSTTNNKYCDSGDGLYAGTCYGSYAATPVYRWQAGPWADKIAYPSTVYGSIMGPCFNRNFDLQSSVSNAQLNDAENPTAASFSYGVNGPMFADNHPTSKPTLRDGMEVNSLGRAGAYYYVDENGARRTGDQPYTLSDKTYSSGSTTKRYDVNDNEGSSVPVARETGGPLSPSLHFGWRVCFKTSLPRAKGEMNTVGVIQPGATGFNSSPPDTCTEQVGDRPYFRVFGGDVAAGGAFEQNGTCSTTPNGSILAWYRPASGQSGIGAGTELGAFALKNIVNFVSASMRTTAPTQPNGLSFANSGTLGNFGSSRCVADYFNTTQFNAGDTRRNPVNGTISPGAIAVGSLNENKQTIVSVPAGSAVRLVQGNLSPPNLRHTIYVDGDVFISENIVYPVLTPTKTVDIPYFTVVAKGNIYIAKNVDKLDGVYIAQRNNAGTGGRIMTCRDNGGGRIAPSDMSANCTLKLTVNGAFIAEEIYLQRTLGTLSTGVPNEPFTASNIAEAFRMGPEFYLGKPVFKEINGLYDSIRALPPVVQSN